MRAILTFSRRRTILALAATGGAAASTQARLPNRDRARPDLYTCEGWEGLAERDGFRLGPVTRIGPEGEPGEPLTVTGVVLSAENRTPVAGVVIYAYQTDARGLYSRGRPETEWSRRHGLLRGWVKTGADGRYTFDTIKPAPYPTHTLPAHIHLTVGEPGRRPYYIDDIVFDGEFGVTDAYRRAQELRGGSGIVRLARAADGHWLARRDIVLELHP